MRPEEQTSRHLLLAVIITVLSGILNFVTLVMSWEFWMVLPVIAGCFSVWILHITKLGADTYYENLCAGVMLIEFFFSAYMNPAFMTYQPRPVFLFLRYLC